MTAQELRIGGLVTINNPGFHPGMKGVPVKVCGITPTLGLLRENTYTVGLVSLTDRENITVPLYSQYIEYIEPIPLTEEWLRRFGFANGEKENFDFTRNMQLRILGYEADYNGLWIGEIEYVHQLQNLYFALTGAELQFKEK
jgi:hypothetical protein